jgi:hypothetical protein
MVTGLIIDEPVVTILSAGVGVLDCTCTCDELYRRKGAVT